MTNVGCGPEAEPSTEPEPSPPPAPVVGEAAVAGGGLSADEAGGDFSATDMARLQSLGIHRKRFQSALEAVVISRTFGLFQAQLTEIRESPLSGWEGKRRLEKEAGGIGAQITLSFQCYYPPSRLAA